MSLFLIPRYQALDTNGDPVSGAKLNFYAAGTSTRQDTYSDSDLTTPNANPVVANSSGLFGPVYLGSSGYKVVLTDSDDVEIWSQDDVVGHGDALYLSGEEVVTVNSDGTIDAITNVFRVDNTDAATAAAVKILNSEGGAHYGTDSGGFKIYQTNTSGVVQDLWVQGAQDGAVTIYHNNSAKLATTSVGVTVTGEIEMGSAGPTLTVGAGAPSASEPNGSIYARTDGTSSTTLYIRAAGAWAALT